MSAWQLSRFWQALTRNPDRRGRYAVAHRHHLAERYVWPLGIVAGLVTMTTWFYESWAVVNPLQTAISQTILIATLLGVSIFFSARGWSSYLHHDNWTTYPRQPTLLVRTRRRARHSTRPGYVVSELVVPQQGSQVPRHPTMGHYDVRGK